MLSCNVKSGLIALLFSFSIFSIAVSRPAPKTVKKKVVSEAAIEPDAMVKATPVHKNLPDQKPAGSPNAVNYYLREGIDVSHYQHTIEWDAVAKTGEVGYVYVKATEGATIQDDTYEYNIKEARRNGIKVGSYHFFRANTNLDDQMQNFTSVAKREWQDLVPIVDVEHTGGLSGDELVSRLKDFMERVTKFYGKRPMLYTFVNFYNRYLSGEGFEKYPLMIAFYRDAQPELYDGRRYIIWQYSSRGRLDGIDGRVDRSCIMEGFSLSDLLMDE